VLHDFVTVNLGEQILVNKFDQKMKRGLFWITFRVLELMSQEQGNNHTWLLSLPLKRETMSWPMKGDFLGGSLTSTQCADNDE